MCVCIGLFVYLEERKQFLPPEFCVHYAQGKKLVVNLFCKPSRIWNIDTLIRGINKYFTLNIKFLKKYIFDTENENFDMLVPVGLSVKFDHSFSSST